MSRDRDHGGWTILAFVLFPFGLAAAIFLGKVVLGAAAMLAAVAVLLSPIAAGASILHGNRRLARWRDPEDTWKDTRHLPAGEQHRLFARHFDDSGFEVGTHLDGRPTVTVSRSAEESLGSPGSPVPVKVELRDEVTIVRPLARPVEEGEDAWLTNAMRLKRMALQYGRILNAPSPHGFEPEKWEYLSKLEREIEALEERIREGRKDGSN